MDGLRKMKESVSPHTSSGILNVSTNDCHIGKLNEVDYDLVTMNTSLCMHACGFWEEGTTQAEAVQLLGAYKCF